MVSSAQHWAMWLGGGKEARETFDDGHVCVFATAQLSLSLSDHTIVSLFPFPFCL